MTLEEILQVIDGKELVLWNLFFDTKKKAFRAEVFGPPPAKTSGGMFFGGTMVEAVIACLRSKGYDIVDDGEEGPHDLDDLLDALPGAGFTLFNIYQSASYGWMVNLRENATAIQDFCFGTTPLIALKGCLAKFGINVEEE